MMLAEKLGTELKQLARCFEADDSPDSLIGVFQQMRPDPVGLVDLFDDIPAGDRVAQRLLEVFESGGEGRRPDGNRDAYFIPRQPPPLSPDRAEALAKEFFANLRVLSQQLAAGPLERLLDPVPQMRVLEGKPPKHPKAIGERAELLNALEDSVTPLAGAFADQNPLITMLQPAVYFMACDAFLRDYVLWPWVNLPESVSGDAWHDPFRPYFQLWRHGVKYRIFENQQVDLYLPRHFPAETPLVVFHD